MSEANENIEEVIDEDINVEVLDDILGDEGEVGDEEEDTKPEPKYSIGDQSFQTLEEARAYADKLIQDEPVGGDSYNAYRQGILDAKGTGQSEENVTQEEQDDFDEEEYFADPKAFLKSYGEKIANQAVQNVTKNLSLKDESNKIWGEFTSRHPKLEDFRSEVEDYVSKNQSQVQKIIAKRGRSDGYDWIALQLTDQFNRYANALKPSRRLANNNTVSVPSGGTRNVTQKKGVKKTMTMAEQIRSIKQKR